MTDSFKEKMREVRLGKKHLDETKRKMSLATSDGRHWRAKLTHCKRGHEFTKENTMICPDSCRHCRRRCRTCNKMIQKNYRLRKKSDAINKIKDIKK